MVFNNNKIELNAIQWWYKCGERQAHLYLSRLSDMILQEILKSYVSYCRTNQIKIKEE